MRPKLLLFAAANQPALGGLRSHLSTLEAIGWLLALLATLFFSMATPAARWVILAGAHLTSVVLARMILATSLSGGVALAVKSANQPTLIAVILTRNEAAHIADCIASVRDLADAVVVWDSGSTDGTQDLAKSAGAQVIFRAFDNYAAQRQAALDAVNAEWILFVDADERVTPGLTAEIRAVLRNPQAVGYWIPRRNVIVGHEMRGGGFTPDHQLRLLRRAAAHYDMGREVHEIVELDGPEDYLSEPLIHYNYANWTQFHRKQKVYAAYEAHILAERGIRPRPHNFILQPLREFRRRFFTLHGYRDGAQGLRMALLLAWYYGAVPYWVLLRGK